MYKTFQLTKEQAEYIKGLRLNGWSWRAVARDTKAKFPELNIDSDGLTYGNQLDGRELCYTAMEMLGEKEEDGWN